MNISQWLDNLGYGIFIIGGIALVLIITAAILILIERYK